MIKEGDKFGSIQVTNFDDFSKMWFGTCACGNVTRASPIELLEGKVTSCGHCGGKNGGKK